MSAETTLKAFILSRYRSVRAFAISSGIPYSTLDNIFRRGIHTISIPSAAALCDELNLDFYAFARGEILPKGEGQDRLTDEESKLLQLFRQLDGHGKKMTFLVAEEENHRLEQRNWQGQVGKPMAARGGGVTNATEEDARNNEQLYEHLLKKEDGGKE